MHTDRADALPRGRAPRAHPLEWMALRWPALARYSLGPGGGTRALTPTLTPPRSRTLVPPRARTLRVPPSRPRSLPRAAPPSSDGTPLVLEALLDEQHAIARRDATHHPLLDLLAHARVALEDRPRLGEGPLDPRLVVSSRPAALIRVDAKRRLPPPRRLQQPQRQRGVRDERVLVEQALHGDGRHEPDEKPVEQARRPSRREGAELVRGCGDHIERLVRGR
mmetsp:Transcript_57027/g.156610  ORF Transcript_57027/g.156610 Transcript_57027/m.156610 type:complete len:222 (-) Transcript_57027:208-873(-)